MSTPTRTRPPSGTAAPTVVDLDNDQVDLVGLAGAVCRRYHDHYTDEQERYGPAGMAWCRHDNQWLLSWAVGDVLGVTDLDEQASWLARVLHGRDFPIDRLVHNLRLAAEVVEQNLLTDEGPAVARALQRAAATVDCIELA